MTRDEIMKLEGRELDAATAKAMGWTSSGATLPNANWRKPDGAACFLPRYHADPAADYEVNEWVKAQSDERLWARYELEFYNLLVDRDADRRFTPLNFKCGDYARSLLLSLCEC